MFGLFKKQKQNTVKPQPYQPEKPVMELFEATKHTAKLHEPVGELTYNTQWLVSICYKGKVLGIFEKSGLYDTYLGEIMDAEGFDADYFSWLTYDERVWLHRKIEDYLREKKDKENTEKRQRVIDDLC